MRYRKLTEDNDYSFGNGEKDFYKDNPEAVAQSVKTRLLLWLGEWFLDIEEGTPYMQGVFGKYTQEEADAIIQDRILTTEYVTSIDNYESEINQDTRKMLVKFELNTAFGPTTVEIE